MIFDQNPRLLRKQYEIGLWLPWISTRKSHVDDQSVSVPMTLSDLERLEVKLLVKIFWRISIIMLTLFDLE